MRKERPVSTAENKTVIRRVFEEAINQGKLEILPELLAPNCVNHDMPLPTPGPEGFRQLLQQFLTAFPDMQIRLDDVLGEGNKVVTRGVMTGTHRAAFMDIPATGKPVSIQYIDVWRLENGKAMENWVRLDLLGLLQQLGAIPAPEQAPA
jgi:steroid delta-isomerase-like uncharacterized protein